MELRNLSLCLYKSDMFHWNDIDNRIKKLEHKAYVDNNIMPQFVCYSS